MGFLLINAVQGYDLGKRLVYSFSPDRTEQALSISELAFAGAFSALPATLVAAPAERVKVLLQVCLLFLLLLLYIPLTSQIQVQGQSGAQAYNGVFDVVTKLYAEGGIRSLFRGTFATLARDGPGSAAYFATYESLKKILSAAPDTLPDGTKAPAPPLSVPAIMTAGAGAGIAMWSLGIPPDVSFFFFFFFIPAFVDRLIHPFSLSLSLDHQIPSPECATGDIYRLHGLCPKAYRSRWCDRSLEGFRTRHGKSCSRKRESSGQSNSLAGAKDGGKLILNVHL